MPGCGEEDNMPPEMTHLFDKGGLPESSGPYDDTPTPDTNKPFVRDMTYEELEELIEKSVRRVISGEDIKREYAKLRATEKR